MVSIIIPCYNVANYIPYTIESVINQNDPDWEIIAVDDGSSDNTFSILTKYAERDRRIRVFHQENCGVSTARNNGIKASTGDIIYFLDGDDRISPFLVKELHSNLCNSDIILFGFRFAPVEKFANVFIPHKSNNYLGEYLINTLTLHISSVAFRRELIINNSLLFDEQTYYSEDREFLIKGLYAAKNVTVIEKILFYYYQRDGSALHLPEYNKRMITSVYALERMYIMLKNTIYGKYALALLNITIILHQASAVKYNCNDQLLIKCLSDKANIYLPNKTLFSFKKNLLLVNVGRISIKSRIIHKLLIRIVSLLLIK